VMRCASVGARKIGTKVLPFWGGKVFPYVV
jgi:hypothetical protein